MMWLKYYKNKNDQPNIYFQLVLIKNLFGKHESLNIITSKTEKSCAQAKRDVFNRQTLIQGKK